MESTAQGWYEVTSRMTLRGRRWHWNLRAPNGEVVASSETYSSFGAAIGGIEAVRAYGAAGTVRRFTEP